LLGKNIVYARIFEGNNKILDLSLSKFKNWNKYKELIELYAKNREKLPEKFDINSPKFELGDTLRAINIIHKYNSFRFK
jgi:hypothetical protein